MQRREFITLLGGAAATWPFAVRAQQRAMPVIGFLSGPTASGREPLVAAFHQGLSEAGYIEGRNVAIEARWAEGQFDRLPVLAAELVQRKVAVIVTFTTPAGLAAKAATSTIPIVLLTGDPVGTGLVESLSRPGGNITGLSYMIPETHGKCVELLRDMLPSLRRVAVLGNAADPSHIQIIEQIRAPRAQGKGCEFPAAPPRKERGGAGASVLPPNYTTKQVADIALKNLLPPFARGSNVCRVGVLLFVVGGALRRAGASFCKKTLQGSKPADLPIEQATKFDLVINLKTAKALGLTVPPTMLTRADEVIE